MDSQSTSDLPLRLDVKTLGFIGAAIFSSYFLIATVIQWYRLRHVPGPLVASFTSLWLYPAVKGMDFHHVLHKTQSKYGKITRIAPDAVVVSDPDTIWQINSARSTYPRGGWYHSVRLNPWASSVLNEMDTVKHDKRKAKLAHGFSGRGLMNLEGNINTQIAALVKILKGRTDQGQGHSIVDIGHILQYFQVDLVTTAGLGEPWGDLSQNKDQYNYLSDADSIIPFAHAIAMAPPLRRIFYSPIFLSLFGPDTTKGWMGILQRGVQRRVQNGNSKQESGYMLDEWLKHGLSPEEAELDLAIMMPAGTETSISVIRAILLYLTTSPNAYQKLKSEISDGIKQGRVSSPVTNEEAKCLSYLQAVLYEGLRIASPVIVGFSKAVPPGGDIICGKALPEGTEVYANLVSMMRDTDVFGPDGDLFLPERFIDCDQDTMARRTKVVDLVFGHGRWLCLGKVMAWMELNKIFVELLRVFDFQVLDPEKPWVRKSTAIYFIDQFYARVIYNPIE